MTKPAYSAGLQFIVSTGNLNLNNRDRRAVRSHTTRAHGRRRKVVQLRSWINPDRRLGLVKESNPSELPLHTVPSPKRIGGDLSALELPLGIEPAMIQDLIQLINLDKEGVYPYEVCLQVHPVERGWFPYMLSDDCCIHSMMFSIRAFLDRPSHGSQTGRQAAFHYAQTLKLLQARLNAFDHGQRDLVLCDSTIMAITILVAAAELTADFAAARNHIDGLLEIVSLKGGVTSLNTHNNMQVKVCRADLGLALRLGSHARLFREGIAWDCFIANRGMIRCSHEPYGSQIYALINTLDPKFGNCWKDVHAFSCVSNLAYQTTRKLSPDLYNEMLISILYRLMRLSFKEDFLQEALRIGVLVFSSTIFLTRHYMTQPYEHLSDLFNIALFKLCQSTNLVVPQPIMLWLMIMYHIVAHKKPSPGDWQSVWLGKTKSLTGVYIWPQAHKMLKSVMWVGFAHDAPGKKAFEAVIQCQQTLR